MKKTMKKVLALVLTVLMCVSVALPVVAADATCPGANADHTKANCSWTEIEKVAVGCGQDGYTLNKCNTCSKYFHDDIVPTTKNHEIKTGASVKPSCTQQGYDICKHCGAKFNIVEGSGEGHRYADFTDANKGVGKPWYPIATGKACNYTKWETKCLNENKWKTNPLNSNNKGVACTSKSQKTYDGDLENHTWQLVVDDAFVAPTCSTEGTGTFKCVTCSTVKTLAIEPTGNHSYTVDVPAKDMDCKTGTPGNYATKGCEYCGAFLNGDADVIPVEHAWGISESRDATCTGFGFVARFCTVCDEEDSDIIAPRGHLGRGEVVDRKDATCQQAGYIEYEHACTRANCPVEAVAVGSSYRDVIPQAQDHIYITKKYNPTCEDDGYTRVECKWCALQKAGTTVVVDVDSASEAWHVWDEGTVYTNPTCTTPGYKAVTCEVCNETKDGVELEPTGHNFFAKDSDGEYIYYDGTEVHVPANTTVAVGVTQPTCSAEGGVNGYRTYTCSECDATKKTYDDDLKFDNGVASMHTGLGTAIKTVAGSCTVKGYSRYFCSTCAKIVDIYDTRDGYNGNHMRPLSFTAEIPAGCDNPNTPEKENYGYAEFWKCAQTDCDYYHGALKNSKGKYVDYTGAVVTTPVPVRYNPHNHDNLVLGKAPTCTEDGYLATWDCDKCGTSFTADDAGYVDPAFGHTWGVRNDVPAAKCGDYGYTHEVCATCKSDRIVNFVYKDHTWNTTLTPATCEKGSFYDCTFAGCEAEKPVDPKLGHIDADGNVIKCATAENFKCYRTCCADSDATTACNKTANSWLTTHNFVNTKFAATCTNYSYDLYVCVDCEYNYRVVHDGDEFQLAAHQWKAQSGKTLYTGAAYSGDEQLNLVAADGYYITTTAAPGTAGVLTRICKECSKTETLNYGAQLYYNISIDNGVVAGAQLVNSGLLKVTLKTTATNLSVWSLKFRLSFDEKVLAYHSYRIMNNAFETGTIVATENIPDVNPNPADTTFVDLPEIVNVIMTAPNNAAAEKQDVTLNGNMQGLIEVYFRVLSNVGYNAAANTGVGGSAKVTVDEVQVVTAANVNYKADPVKSDNKIGGDNYDQKTIYMLGDVTNDAITSTSVASLLDASALMDFYKAEKYNAMADIDKNGKVDLADFAALMTYIADGKYNVLVANGVN